jgi:hydrogenase maturation protein HypF
VERRVSTVVSQRRRVTVTGVVQGVGFRPFVHRLATELGLHGFVGNDASGVFIELEGPDPALDAFERRLTSDAPPLAVIESVAVRAIAPMRQANGFRIVESDASAVVGVARTLVPPDVATCDECLAEVLDPDDRRYRYPFTNCTNCGPRFTIIRDLPYDRPATTMAGFTMCPACAAEYHDPADRRYHAQPVACPRCGPRLAFERGPHVVVGTDAVIGEVQAALAAGLVVAVKGLGGYHLACDARSDTAVTLLRERKGRVDKPFAVMVPDLDAAREMAIVTPADAAALTSPSRPIVLLRRRAGSVLSPLVAPANPHVGVMLPYTPLHHLLFRSVPSGAADVPRVVVFTSGNLTDEPICFDDDDARRRMAPLADAFCTHDRPIEVPCDDSVVRVVDGVIQPVRRSRGYAPLPVALPVSVAPTLAVGGELKNTCCLAAGRHAWVSQHIGDMGTLETLQAFERGVAGFRRMYGVEPEVWAADEHPGYATRRWAMEHAGAALRGVQHHHAHVAAVMAEHGRDGSEPVIGMAFDGTGYGRAADGTVQIWGGEVLVVDYLRSERVGHLAPLPLPGGDAGVRNPCRIAVAYLAALDLPFDPAIPAVAACDDLERAVVLRQVARGIGCVPTTSMGRLFDAVASLLGVRHRVTYEAQAAMELEAVADEGAPGAVELAFGTGPTGVLDPAPVLRNLVTGLAGGGAVPDLALGFHRAVAGAVLASALAVSRRRGLTTVALTGGVFQNALLVRLARSMLEDAGFEVLTHRLVPPNDGGLSLGQALVAGHRAAAGFVEGS